MEEAGCEIISGAQTTLAVKGVDDDDNSALFLVIFLFVLPFVGLTQCCFSRCLLWTLEPLTGESLQ